MKKNLNLKKINIEIKAFTIVETLVTLLAITVMIAAPLTFMVRSYNYANFITARIIASGLSQEGLELVTSLRNKNLANFKTLADNCATSCFIDWDGESDTPTLVPCTDESCKLYKSATDATVLYRGSGVGDTETDFYRYIKLTPNATQGYTVESISYTNVENVKIEVNIKKLIFNINIK